MKSTRIPSRRGSRPTLLPLVAIAAVLMLAGLTAATAGAKNLGEWTDADVGVAVQNGVNYLFTQVDTTNPAQVHWDAADDAPDIAQTTFAIAAVGSALSQSQATLNATQQSNLNAAIQWLISQQDTSGTDTDGAFGVTDGLANYETSIALVALSFFQTQPGAANASAKARAFEIKWQHAPPAVTGNPSSACTAPSLGNYGNCGSWTYSGNSLGGGDASNTGFGITGLDFSGGVPAGTAAENANWATATQELSSNPYHTYNDGCGSYEPNEGGGDFTSNANDTGTILFSFAYDAIPSADPRVAAAMACGTNILDTYELVKSQTPRTMIYHAPPTSPFNLDPACVIGSLNCNWQDGGDGGYHYSLFALSKGFGSFITANIADTSNFYAKVVDLLLSEQVGDGSWPADLRDDGSTIGATSFAILALTKAGQTQAHPPAPPVVPPAPKKPPAPKVGVAGVRRACASKAFSIRLKVATSSSLAVKRVTVKLDGKKVRTTTKSTFRLKVNTKRLKAGRHRLTITAVDAAGGVTTIRRTFSVCKAIAPKRRAAPRFTG
jgi:Bacterial Ig domain